MTNNPHHEHQTPRRSASQEITGLSMMAVQELLGLFTEHQKHASQTLADSGNVITDLQAVLENYPLSYL